MAGTIVIARPTATVATGGLALTGGASVHAVLSDASDASYAAGRSPSGGPHTEVNAFSATWPGAGPKIAAVRLNARISGDGTLGATTGGTFNTFSIKHGANTTPLINNAAVNDTAGASTFQSSWQYLDNSSFAAWVQTDITSLSVIIDSHLSGGGTASKNRILDVWLEINYTDVQPAPTAVTPTAGSTVTTDVPTLGMTTADQLLTSGRPGQKGEWNLATDAGFTTNLKDVVEADIDFKAAGGATTEVVPTGLQLFQSLWYMRARAVDGLGTQGTWSATQSFTVAHAPSTSGQSPTGDVTRDFGGSGNVTLSWLFTDPSPVDNQTAYQVVVERNDTAALILDTGKVTSAAQLLVVTIPAIQKDQPLRWKVKVWDSDDVASPYSSYFLFRASDKPTVTTTYPSAGTVDSPQPTFTWTFAASGGRTQASYRVLITQQTGGATVHDSGVKVGNATSYTPPTPVLAVGGTYVVQITATDNVNLANSDTDNFTATWTPPASPTSEATDISLYDTGGYVNITWNATVRDTGFYAWRVYRRLQGAASWTLLYETTNSATAFYRDYFASSLTAYEYTVVQVANRFNTLLESTYVWMTAVTPTTIYYWLMHPTDPTKNIRFIGVTSDTYTEEYETETLHVIGRGRKVDVGDRLGFNGSLTAQIRANGPKAPRLMRLDLEAIRATKSALFLKNPFGDVWQVMVGDMQFSRISGVGTAEFFDVTIPYTEVA